MEIEAIGGTTTQTLIDLRAQHVIRTDLADWLSFPLVFDPGVGGQKNKDLDREQCGALALLVYHLGGMSPAGKKGLGGVLGVIDSLFDKLKREGGYSEKKRVDLAEMVSQGTIQPRPAPADPVAQLVLSAHEVLPSLPAGKQREVLDLIAKLTQARARDDHEALGQAVSLLTAVVKQSRS
jgi:hypothetical protein